MDTHTILIVYDSQAIRETVSVLEFDDDQRVIELDAPDNLGEAVETHAPDLVLLCAMTRRTGAYANCRALKDETPAGTFLPVVIYALRVGERERAQAAEAGADALVQVTSPSEDLLFTLRSLLRIRQGFRESQGRAAQIARASAEAADMMLQLEEADRRIREQNDELSRMVRELEARDRRIQAQQAEIQRHLERLQKDMDLAAALQVRLLPEMNPDEARIRLASRYIPATDLGGDYYDCFRLPDGSLHLNIADVTGHGVAPALVSVQVRTAVRNAAEAGRDAAGILDEANRFMVATFRGEFLMTMSHFVLPPDDADRLVFAGAGHCPAIRWTPPAAAPAEHPSRGLPLGVTAETTFPAETLPFRSGDRLLLYTDGITETVRAGTEDEEFGPEGLLAFLEAHPERTAETLLDDLIRTVRDFGAVEAFGDDVTLVLLERR